MNTDNSPNGKVKKPNWVFSGDNSVKLWDEINGANTVKKLRSALYYMGCKCQELETEVRKLSNTK